MHAQIVTFTLNDLDEDGYRALGTELAPAYADLPGLLTKVWLASPETNTYGGVYFWDDRAAMDRYLASDLLRTVMRSPHLANLTSRDFSVYEDITRETQPTLKIFPAPKVAELSR
jgi:Putative mono-oxygenase ydhR